jgi:hypothetical protein
MNNFDNARLRRYRQRNRRIDYYPSPDVADIIAHHQSNSGEPCIAGILDGLIRAGHRMVSGNGGKR